MSKTEYLVKIFEDKYNGVCVTTLFKHQVTCKDTQTYTAHTFRYHKVFFHSINT